MKTHPNNLIAGAQPDISKELLEKDKEIEELKRTLENERERASGLLAELEKFKLAVESASDHIVITDQDGYILYANIATQNITGFPVSEIVGMKAGKQWALPMDKAYYEKLWHVIKTEKKPFKGMIRNRRKNGEVYDALVSISPVLGEGGEPRFFVGLERDITKEAAIDRAKTEFVSVASHQLRTPLAAMNWYLEILRNGEGGELNEKQREYLTELENNNRKMIELVNNLLNASRFEMGTFTVTSEIMDIVSVLEGVVHETKTLFEKKKLDLKTEIVELPKTKLDPDLVRFVFQNLFSNAIKYTPEGGKVLVSLKRKNNEAEFTIQDNGVGIPASLQGNIFKRFFRADNVQRFETEGNGLGLYIVKSIVDALKGTVRFESKEGRGTTFFVTLPLNQQ